MCTLILALVAASALPVAAQHAPHVATAVDRIEAPELSNKARFLADKATRPQKRARKAPPTGVRPPPVLTLHNVWTHESLPVVLDHRRAVALVAGNLEPRFDELTRCHYTNEATHMDPRLLGTVLRAAARFHSLYVEIVSGFRAPKYQLTLRKKGHEVARESQHPLGHAVDFRIPGVRTRTLYRYIRRLRLGGVGYYPDSEFVHTDVGRVRHWRGH